MSVSCTTQEYDNVMYNILLSNFSSMICQVVTYGRLKSKENFKIIALKVVAVA